MLVSVLFPSFLDRFCFFYIISWTLGLVHRHLLSCSLVYLFKICFCQFLKNGPEYPTRGTAQGFIFLIRFLLQCLFSRFIVHLKYSFVIFFSPPLIWWCPLSIFPSTCNFSFLQEFWFVFDLAFLFLPSFPNSKYRTFLDVKFHSFILAVYFIVRIRVSNAF